jgi:hypothetical protein
MVYGNGDKYGIVSLSVGVLLIVAVTDAKRFDAADGAATARFQGGLNEDCRLSPRSEADCYS